MAKTNKWKVSFTVGKKRKVSSPTFKSKAAAKRAVKEVVRNEGGEPNAFWYLENLLGNPRSHTHNHRGKQIKVYSLKSYKKLKNPRVTRKK